MASSVTTLKTAPFAASATSLRNRVRKNTVYMAFRAASQIIDEPNDGTAIATAQAISAINAMSAPMSVYLVYSTSRASFFRNAALEPKPSATWPSVPPSVSADARPTKERFALPEKLLPAPRSSLVSSDSMSRISVAAVVQPRASARSWSSLAWGNRSPVSTWNSVAACGLTISAIRCSLRVRPRRARAVCVVVPGVRRAGRQRRRLAAADVSASTSEKVSAAVTVSDARASTAPARLDVNAVEAWAAGR
ncbi:hypothetical protein FM119_00415 [Mycetocola reblochoni REB411]|uniref:Uncharacterized protein n=2 Tax=Mycetocola reblochoni TaxID=331618 RepID=A0A1R4I8S3_9MICO|nr:hypothetical protein FM119_00415 [Mycetocola reblochoni REB411]